MEPILDNKFILFESWPIKIHTFVFIILGHE